MRPQVFGWVPVPPLLVACASWIATSTVVTAEDPLPSVERLQSSPVLRHLKPNPMPAPPRSPAEQTIARMYVPEGFRVEVIAAEPDVRQPVAFAWDERGRLWFVEAYSYPAKRPPGEGLDKIIILSDEDGDGRFETRRVFAEGLNLASAIEVGHGGVWIGAAPELLFIPDRNHDDTPDGPPEVLLEGFGYQDTHETLNSFLWGPDGWLYGLQGVFNTARIGKPGVPPELRPELRAGVWRFHPVRREFEIFASGGSNPWGLDYDAHGELFMTHCRSYWGKGLTTHVLQGGHYWNQVNANHAPFVIAQPPKEFPELRNYLLASARYDHGAGGAGVPGSDAIYGGHSHVGTMIYLGDNWPDTYRGRLFTHNLGGHQMNQQINHPLGSGFDTVHAGQDVLFCSDSNYVAVDLQYGPDGAVYFIDWHDPQHCHNPNTERWDRTNGRIYRMQWQATFKPVKVNLAMLSDVELVALQRHKNQWYARTARRLLHERALGRHGVAKEAMDKLDTMLAKETKATVRLNALWAWSLSQGAIDSRLIELLADSDPWVRGWVVRIAADRGSDQRRLAAKYLEMARTERSPVARRYLASVAQRLPEAFAWPLLETLARCEEDKDDRNLPSLLWQSLAIQWSHQPLKHLDRALDIARRTPLPRLADWIWWYAATLEGEPLNRVVSSLDGLDEKTLHRRLACLWLAMEPRANVPMPKAWPSAAPALYASNLPQIQRLAERLAAVFGDPSAFPRLRTTLADSKADGAARQHAFAVLSRAQDRASLPVFLELLDDPAIRTAAMAVLARFDAPEVAAGLVRRFNQFTPAERSSALDALTARTSYAMALLDAVAAGQVARDQLTAFHISRLAGLKNADVDERVTATWGRISQTPAEKQRQIAKLEHAFNEAPLWAYSALAGQQHFQKLCTQCHRVGQEGARLGPELTGAGKHGVRYFLENIIDPDAVIGTDFRATNIETQDGESISGLLAGETPSAVTLRTTAGESVIPKTHIKSQVTSEKSLMPEGLIEGLNEREQIELLKFMTTH